jgi:polyisoprenoid-binding protein YceI
VKKIALGLILASVALPAAAEPESFTIDPNHTYPSWEILHFGVSVQRGRFNKTTGKITIDPAAGTGTAEVVIDATTVDTGHPHVGERLRGADFFDVAKYPTLTFKGSHFAFEGDKVKSIGGELTMIGVSKPVTLNAVTYNCGTHPAAKKKFCGGDFVATIKRSDWGMSKFIPAVSDDLTLRINVEAIKD